MRQLKQFGPLGLILVGFVIGVFFTDVTKPVTMLVLVALLLIVVGFGWLCVRKS